MDTMKMIKAMTYYDKLFDEESWIKIPRYVNVHHYLGIVITSIIETQANTFFILPLVLMLFTHYLVIQQECKTRIIDRCLSEEAELEPLTNFDRDVMFYDYKEAVLETGFIYTRTILLVRSLILIFLIYYATLGLLI